MKQPLVSAYIPTFNRADLLIERCLTGILAQTYANLEIIVVADGCTDDTAQRVRALGDTRIRVVDIARRRRYPPSPENHWFAGRVAAANAGLRECAGAWIATCDDDDVWTPDHVETLLRFAQKGDYEFVSSGYECIFDVGGCETHRVVMHDGETPPIGGIQTWLYRAYLKSFRFNPDCWRKRWNAVCDVELADRFRKAGVRIGLSSAVTVRIYPRPGQQHVGLKAYRENAEKTLNHFAFTK